MPLGPLINDQYQERLSPLLAGEVEQAEEVPD
jgi:hypothetical protein